MARPKRMGAYNALDDLLPGPAWSSSGDDGPAWDLDPPEAAPAPRRARLEPVPDPPSARRRPRGRRRAPNALDDLLPGPRGGAGTEAPPAGPSAPAGRRRGPAPGRPRRGGRHLGVWNPLDGPPPPAPEVAPVPAKARLSFRLPADLVETARDAVAHLAGTSERTTLTALTERALRVELARLAITHNGGRPFPPRQP
jgi:hypothetical protein